MVTAAALLAAATSAPVGCSSERGVPAREPVGESFSPIEEMRTSDLFSWYPQVASSTVPASTDPAGAAVAIWDEHRGDSPLATDTPTIEWLGSGRPPAASEVLPSLRVSTVIEVCGIEGTRTSGPVSPYLTHLGRYVVVARGGDAATAFMIGRYQDGWRYVPAAPFDPTAVDVARTNLATVTAFIAASAPNDTDQWWLLGEDDLGGESVVAMSDESTSPPTPQSSDALWAHLPTLFSGSRR